MKKLILIFIVIISVKSFSQKLNAYKYAVVPEKFSFQTENNQYNFNELVKAAMRRYGFDPYYNTEELPADVTDANKLYVDVVESGNIIYTKLNIVLKDYRNNIVFMTQDGKSKEKQVEVAYNEALRETVKSVELMNHHYTENTIVENNEPSIDNKVVIEEDKLIIYIAKQVKNGYDLSTQDQVFLLKNTSKKDMYQAVKNKINGTVFKQGDKWIFEFYRDEELIQQEINIKFQ